MGGLALHELRKHRGRYFDILIKKIENKEALEVLPVVSTIYPNGVIIDDKVVPYLLNAYYPSGDKTLSIIDGGNNVVSVTPAVFKRTIPTLNGPPILLGHINKTREFRIGVGINLGNIAEGVLGAAITAKFVSGGREVGVSDISNILEHLTCRDYGKTKFNIEAIYSCNYRTRTHHSNIINLRLILNKTDFGALISNITTHGVMDSTMLSLIKSALVYVNSQSYCWPATITNILHNKTNNSIEIISDGVSNSKSTKTDIIVKLNNAIIKGISLKSQNVRQFGQASGYKFDNFKNFVADWFDGDISVHEHRFKSTKSYDATTHNHSVMGDIYRTHFSKILNDNLSVTHLRQAFIDKIISGIIKHATNGDDIDIVKFLGNIDGGVKVLKFDKTTLQELNNLTYTVAADPDPTKSIIRIYGKTDNTIVKGRLGINDTAMLLQLRNRIDVARGYIRNVVEMGPMLTAIATVDVVDIKLDTTENIEKLM